MHKHCKSHCKEGGWKTLNENLWKHLLFQSDGNYMQIFLYYMNYATALLYGFKNKHFICSKSLLWSCTERCTNSTSSLSRYVFLNQYDCTAPRDTITEFRMHALRYCGAFVTESLMMSSKAQLSNFASEQTASDVWSICRALSVAI